MSTNSPTQTLQPPAGLVLANSQDPDKPLFCLFTEDWIQLQTFIAQTPQLPIITTNFEDKYGKFKDEGEVENVVAAMKAIQGLSTSFGDPTALFNQFAKDPTILQGPTAPEQLYTHIIWYATKLNLAAITFN